MSSTILVLGAGFGGLEVVSRLADRLGPTADIIVIDEASGFVPGSAHLQVLFGGATIGANRHPYQAIAARPGVRFVESTIREIDPAGCSVLTDGGRVSGDVMVVALGATCDPTVTPGLSGAEFYTLAGLADAQQALHDFAGGDVLIAAATPVFKCPPAPSAAALLLHDYLTARMLRDASRITVALPGAAPVPPAPEASRAIEEAFAAHDIVWQPGRTLIRVEADSGRGVDPGFSADGGAGGGAPGARRIAHFADGGSLPADLVLGVPVHTVPAVVSASGLCENGWIPVDPQTCATAIPGVFAIGDVTSIGTPKAGAFAAAQAAVVADRIAADVLGRDAQAVFDGTGACFMPFGGGTAARIEVTARDGKPVASRFDPSTTDLFGTMVSDGAALMEQWFGRGSVAALD